MAAAAPKMAAAGELVRAIADTRIAVHVDGGVNRDTAVIAGAWGADICVVGSALFQRGQDAADEVRIVRLACRRGPDATARPGGAETRGTAQPSHAVRA